MDNSPAFNWIHLLQEATETTCKIAQGLSHELVVPLENVLLPVHVKCDPI